MKICFICSEYPPARHGGVGSMTQVLGRALVRNGHSVRVAGVYRQSEAVREEEDEGVRILRLRDPEPRFSWILARYRLFQAVSDWVKQGDVDLIEVPDYEGWAAGWPALDVPVVVRLHGTNSYFAVEMGAPLDRTTYWLERAALRRCDSYCSTSAYTAERTRRLFGLKKAASAVLYNPVEIPSGIPSSNRSSNRVIFTGTLTPKKGIIPLTRAWPAVRESCPDAELHIFGKDGLTADRQSMQAFLRKLLDSHAASVFFYGHTPREKLLNELRKARVAVFPSYAEAFAMAPLEAMVQGCPTIYSRLGSGPELIEDRHDGLLVNPDRPQEIANAIIRVLKDDQLAGRLGEAGRLRVLQTFSCPVLVARNEAYYGECLDRFRRASRN